MRGFAVAAVVALCSQAVLAHPHEAHDCPHHQRGKAVEPARAKGNLSALVSDDDYPLSARTAGEAGTARVKLEVGPNGRVTNCLVLQSSGSAALDSATCRIMRSRARFTPARDAQGIPATDSIEHSLTWRLPAA